MNKHSVVVSINHPLDVFYDIINQKLKSNLTVGQATDTIKTLDKLGIFLGYLFLITDSPIGEIVAVLSQNL